MAVRFDMLAAAYDAMIDWDKRLVNEAPLFREVFGLVGAESVLDAACGTGRHAGLFASWGLKVEGADVNAAMIDHCREAYGAIANMEFVVRGFSEAPKKRFDAVVCVGNSLALAEDLEHVAASVAAMASGLNPGGALVIQVMNIYAREDGPVRWEKTRRLRLQGHDALVIKGTHRCGDCGYVDFLLTNLEQDPPVLKTDSVRLVGMKGEQLKAACEQAGLHAVTCYGDYRKSGYDPSKSADLVLIGRKPK